MEERLQRVKEKVTDLMERRKKKKNLSKARNQESRASFAVQISYHWINMPIHTSDILQVHAAWYMGCFHLHPSTSRSAGQSWCPDRIVVGFQIKELSLVIPVKFWALQVLWLSARAPSVEKRHLKIVQCHYIQVLHSDLYITDWFVDLDGHFPPR